MQHYDYFRRERSFVNVVDTVFMLEQEYAQLYLTGPTQEAPYTVGQIIEHPSQPMRLQVVRVSTRPTIPRLLDILGPGHEWYHTVYCAPLIDLSS